MTSLKKETWENVSRGVVGYLESDPKGPPRGKLVRGGARFTISTEDRIMNQDLAMNDGGVFQNGRLQPVRLIDTAEDYEEIAANPNFMSESDITDLLKRPIKEVRARLDEVTSVTTVNLIAEIARADENIKKIVVDAVESRLDAFTPENVVEVVNSTSGTGRAARTRAVTP